MCRVLRVSKSGFYRARSATPSARASRSTRIRAAVKQVHEQSNGIYGSYKIAQRLQTDDQLETACRNTVATAMVELGLKSKVSKWFKPATTVVDPDRKPADNLLDQVFETDQPNRKWVADIAYLPTQKQPSATRATFLRTQIVELIREDAEHPSAAKRDCQLSP